MRPSEKKVKNILEKLLPQSKVIPFDDGSKENVHDFDLKKEGEFSPYAAVEVTSTVNPDIKKIEAIFKRKNTIAGRNLKNFWHLYITENFVTSGKIGRKWSKFEEYLLPIEAANIKNFFAPTLASENPFVLNIWQDLKVEFGSSQKTTKPRILLSYAGGGGLITSQLIRESVEREAFKDDNRNKLKKAKRNEKHLFIIVDAGTDYCTWVAMRDGKPPAALPELPAEINTVWVATWLPGDKYRVWRVSPPGKWEILGDIELEF